MTLPHPDCWGDGCTRLAADNDDHGNPTCGEPPCPPISSFSLSIDIAADGTATVDYTPPGGGEGIVSVRRGSDGAWAVWSRGNFIASYDTHGEATRVAAAVEQMERQADPCATTRPDTEDMHLVGLDLPEVG